MFFKILSNYSKKLFAGAVLAAASIVAFSVQAYCSQGTVNGDAVNVRAEASASASVVASYNKGQAVTITEVEGDWYRIVYNDGRAYIYKEYVTIVPDTYYVTVDCDGLNFRKEPDENSEKIKLLPKGYNLTLTKNCDDWMQVKDESGNIGYVSTKFITISKGATPSNAAFEESVVSTSSSKGEEVAAFAQKYVGLRYIYGGTNLSVGTDCSGFTSAIYKQFGVTLNRTSRSQASNGVSVSKSDIKPGDLVLFDDGSQIDHVGMYIGNNKYIHNSMNAGKVVISDFSGPYVKNHLAGIRRVI